MRITRRKLIADGSRFAAGATLAGALASCGDGGGSNPVSGGEDIAAPLDDDGYWAFADQLAETLNDTWSPDDRAYRVEGDRFLTVHNAEFLLTHSVAALKDHDGPARQDDRCRELLERICEEPPWLQRRPANAGEKDNRVKATRIGPQFHTPGWLKLMDGGNLQMDKSIEPRVAEAMVYAHEARERLGLSEDLVRLMKRRVRDAAYAKFFRYPSVRLNQIDWQADIYAHNFAINDDPELLRDDFRKQLERFMVHMKTPWGPGGSPTVGPGYRFHYLPYTDPAAPKNYDAPEYALITIQFVKHYDQAVKAGMKPLPEDDIRLLTAWAANCLYSYWTHAGYLNWDTGLGAERLHSATFWGHAQQGLLALAVSPTFHPRREFGDWAKFVFDRALTLYRGFAAEGDGLAPPILYGFGGRHSTPADRELAAARVQANAARAVALGLGGKRASEPPAMWSYDGPTGRLSISTKAYSTAVVPVNQGAFDYGGIELARLFDGEGRVAATTGGVSQSAFGVLVRDAQGRRVLASQEPKERAAPGQLPLTLVSSPRGAVRVEQPPYALDPYSGPFRRLEATSRATAQGVDVDTTHRFSEKAIETSWTIASVLGRPYSVDVLFPSWGARTRVVAVLRGGDQVVLAGEGERRREVPLADVRHFELIGDEAGYVMVPRGGSRAIAHALVPRRQTTAPDPGPTLLIGLSRKRAFDRLEFTARIAPATPGDGGKVAGELRRD